MTYAEYLRANGASEDEVKVLVTPTSERAFAAQQAELAKSTGAVNAYKKWFDEEAVPAYKKMEKDLIITRANEARAREALIAARDKGLVDITKDLGYDPVNPTPPPAPLDPRYVTLDTLHSVADREGEAIAQAYNIGAEHAQLFPNVRLDMVALRREALARKIPVEQAWMEKYKVEDARAAQAKAAQDARDEQIRKEAYDKARQEFADTYGNPAARPPVSSNSPFVHRPATGRDKQPWEMGDRSNDRVRAATTRVLERQASGYYGGQPPRPN